jgi:hypothetical protein
MNYMTLILASLLCHFALHADTITCYPGGTTSNNSAELDEERRRILEEREKWEKEKSDMTEQRNEVDYQRAMSAVDNVILDLLPKVKEAKQTVDLLNRVTMTFDVVLEKGTDQVPRVKISVENSSPKLSILIDPQEFLPKLSLLKDEMMKLRSAIDAGREYELPERHDPLYLMFDNDFHLGNYPTRTYENGGGCCDGMLY